MKFLADKETNTGRQIEADMAKFVCLVGMVIVHCFDTFVSFSELTTGVQYVFGFVLNSIFGAGTFMFCMGLGIAYSGRSTPRQMMRRGLILFGLGYLLNLACALSYLILLGDMELFVTYLLGLDIMQFAGLAFLLFGFLKYLKCPDWGIGAAAVGLSVIGTFARTIDLGNPLANIFCGLFIGTFDYEWMTGGIFPLCNWFIFVAAGYFFAKILRRCENKAKLYGIFAGISAVILAVYMLIAIPNGYGMMGSILRFHQIEIHEAFISIAGAVFSLGVYYALSRLIPAKAQQTIVGVSRNINAIYCIQWVIIAWTVSIWVLAGKHLFSDGVIILIGFAIFLLSAFAARMWAGIKAKRKAKAL